MWLTCIHSFDREEQMNQDLLTVLVTTKRNLHLKKSLLTNGKRIRCIPTKQHWKNAKGNILW